jgi:hypothetical protein
MEIKRSSNQVVGERSQKSAICHPEAGGARLKDLKIRSTCHRRCHWRSFSVLRRISLAALAQRLRQLQDDNLLDV